MFSLKKEIGVISLIETSWKTGPSPEIHLRWEKARGAVPHVAMRCMERLENGTIRMDQPVVD